MKNLGLKIGDTFHDKSWNKTITVKYLNHDTDTVGFSGYEGTPYLKSNLAESYLFSMSGVLGLIEAGVMIGVRETNVNQLQTFGAFSLN